MELGGLPFSVSLGVPQQQYQHVVATLPLPQLRKLQGDGEPGDMEEEEEEGEGEGEAEEEEGGGGGGGAAAGARKAAGRHAFVVAGPVAHTLSVVPDLETMLRNVDLDGAAARGVSLGGGVTSTSHLVLAYRALSPGQGSQLVTGKRGGGGEK